MELQRGRLKATLIAGGIRPTDKALSIVSVGLGIISHGYHIERVISSEVKTKAELAKELGQLHAAFCTVIGILDADMNGLNEIGAPLSEALYGRGIGEFVEELRTLSSHTALYLNILAQNTAIRRRRQNPETWFFLAAHDLFATLTDDEKPGIAGPLHRFTKYCAALIDERIKVPESENAFQKRLTAALRRRTGKIDVTPREVFPGKIAPRI
jgi:hypothetical protein